jgi:single-stranded DNA-binding protein
MYLQVYTGRNKEKNGGYEDRYLNAICFGTTAENVHKRVEKGHYVMFTGEFQVGEPWEKKDGTTETPLELLVDRWNHVVPPSRMTTVNGDGQTAAPAPEGGEPAAGEPETVTIGAGSESEDPFV